MTIARIENGTVIETRELSLSDLPEHKRAGWRPVTGTPPAYDPRVEAAGETGWIVTATEAQRQFTVTPHPRDAVIRAVKREAQRRIIAATGADDIIGCLIRQQNGVSAEVQTEIARLRAKSDAIEALDPLPSDWASDARWSA